MNPEEIKQRTQNIKEVLEKHIVIVAGLPQTSQTMIDLGNLKKAHRLNETVIKGEFTEFDTKESIEYLEDYISQFNE